MRGMKLSTNPSVWRVALASIVGAVVALGVLPAALGDQINTLGTALAAFIPVVLGVIGAIWSKTATLPVDPGAPASRLYVRGADDVYRPATNLEAHADKLNATAKGRGQGEDGPTWPERS